MGKMKAYLPYVGYITIILNDNPMFKYFVLGLMAFFTIVAKDPQ
jgi:signal peptidase